MLSVCVFFFFKQKTAYEMRISDWSSDGVLFRSMLAVAVVGAGLLAGCVPIDRGESTAPRGEAIAISRGPCFGFCPVYDVAVSPGGRVDFEGTRNTVVLGTRSRSAGKAAYRKVSRSLAPPRPATGQDVEFQCTAQHTATPLFPIEWTSAPGPHHALPCPQGWRT